MTDGTQPNNQTLPPGIQERAQAAGQQPQYQPPPQPTYPQQPAPYQQQPVPQEPQAPQEPPHNAMLSRFSQQQPPQDAPQPPTQHLQEPPQEPAPKEPEKPAPKAKQNTAPVADIIGDLADDPYAKPSVTYIENMCSTSDVDLGRAFNKAVEYGDASLIDEAYLRDQLGENADAVIQQATSLFEYSAHKAKESLTNIYQTVGNGDAKSGEALLKQSAEYFNKAGDPAEKAEIEYLLDSGNKDLMARAAQRIVQFAQQGGMTYQPGQQPLGNPSSAKGLSRQEYVEKISAQNLSPEQYQELRKLREIGRKQGI